MAISSVYAAAGSCEKSGKIDFSQNLKNFIWANFGHLLAQKLKNKIFTKNHLNKI